MKEPEPVVYPRYHPVYVFRDSGTVMLKIGWGKGSRGAPLSPRQVRILAYALLGSAEQLEQEKERRKPAARSV